MYKLLLILGIIALVCSLYFVIVFALKKKKILAGAKADFAIHDVPLKIAKYAVLIIVFISIILPFAYAILLSFKTSSDIFNSSMFPSRFVLRNYVYVLIRDQQTNLLRGFLNSFIYTIVPVTFGVLSSTMAAYALSRLHFKGRDNIFGVLFATMCIPGIITFVPSYLMFHFYGWTQEPSNILPLLIPGCCGSVSVIFFLRQYLLTIPKEVDEAGLVDGLSKGGIFFHIILPLSWPAMLAQFLLCFNAGYNDFMTPMLYLGSNKDLQTIQLMIYNISTSTISYNKAQVMAACVLALIPSILLFGFGQKYFLGSNMSVEGLK